MIDILGITWKVNYTYTYTVNGNATIAVTIGGGGSTTLIWVKNNNTWSSYTKAYKKVNGSWVLQPDLTTVFQQNVNYRRG